MVCPRWVRTPIQPIALRDVVAYLTGALHVEPKIYEVGGADVTTYRDMILAYAKVRGLRTRRIVDVPYLTPHLSSYWVDLVTPVDQQVGHALIESLATEVVVRTRAQTDQAFGIQPLGLAEAIAAALDDQRESIDHRVMDLNPGLREGVYVVRTEIPCDVEAALLDADLSRIGGSYRWYGLAFPWRVRAALGRLVGEQWQLEHPAALSPGTPVDWWTVASREPGSLVLRATRWFPGEAWLGWKAIDGQLVQVGALRTRGLTGFLYWKTLAPIHRWIFLRLARTRLRRARAGSDPNTGADVTAFPNR